MITGLFSRACPNMPVTPDGAVMCYKTSFESLFFSLLLLIGIKASVKINQNKPEGFISLFLFLFLKQTNKHNHKTTSAQKVHSLGKRKVLGWTLPTAV